MDLGFLTARPIAHRGYHDIGAGRIENTLPAVMAAVERGFAIEVDVQLSADGEAVVFHDETLDRLTEASGRVDALSLEALQRIPFKANPETRIPSLPDLLAAVAGRVPLVVEIKSEFRRPLPTRLTDRTAELLSAYRGPVAAMSFDPEIVARLRRIAPDLPRGIVADDATDTKHYGAATSLDRFSLRHLTHAPRTRPHFVSYWVKKLDAPGPTFLHRILGVPLICWTVRTPEDWAKARAAGAQITFEGFDPDAAA